MGHLEIDPAKVAPPTVESLALEVAKLRKLLDATRCEVQQLRTAIDRDEEQCPSVQTDALASARIHVENASQKQIPQAAEAAQELSEAILALGDSHPELKAPIETAQYQLQMGVAVVGFAGIWDILENWPEE